MAAGAIRFDRAREIVIQRVTKVCHSRFGSGLRALILTGSLARGEGSLQAEPGAGEAAGDAEFILVLQDGVSEPEPAEAAALAAEMETNVRRRELFCQSRLAIGHADICDKCGRTYSLRNEISRTVVLARKQFLSDT